MARYDIVNWKLCTKEKDFSEAEGKIRGGGRGGGDTLFPSMIIAAAVRAVRLCTVSVAVMVPGFGLEAKERR